ncbi:MAG TPA: S9 family peptidase [Gemmatimonadaceae bacterium]|nr:S9 family peptidase [Gemmatimonadaceae bacterium]
MRALRFIGAIACLLVVAISPVAAQQRATSDRLALEQYLDWEDVRSPQLSPDGSQILFTRRWIDKMNDKWESSIWQMNADGSHQHELVRGSDVQWSPDGTRIAYIARGEPTGQQIFVRWMDAEGGTTQISHLTESPSALEWSPDGKWIAFTMNVPVHDSALRIHMPTPPKGAKWIAPPKVVTRLNYRRDRIGFTDEAYRHIFVIPAGGGTARQITSGDWDDAGISWSSDGTRIAFSSLREPNSEEAFRQSNIYAVNVASGDVAQLTARAGTSRSPVYSPDGHTIAFLSADSVDHSAWAETNLWMMNADGSNAHMVSGKLDRPISGVMWASDNSGVYFTVDDAGAKNLYFATVGGQVRPVTSGAQVLTVSAVGKNGRAVGVRSTPTQPNDVVTFTVPKSARGTVTEFAQLTDVDADVLAGKTIGETEEIWYTSTDGLKVQGWIVKPPGFDPHKKYPLLLQIHGGPQAMYDVGFNFARQDFAAHDYIVLYTNPRGSTGYGEKFTNEIKNAYPGKDFDDLMAGVDTVVGRGYIDTHNMFVYGCSGGGVLTAWTVGHTDRFAAAAALCPVIDWISFVGETDGAGWYQNFAHPFWEDPAEYLRRSPIMYVGNVKTPTLLMTGVLDLRTPIPQIEEFYRALRVHGVPTAMIRMNNEYHGTSSTPSNFLRTQLYLRAWFDKYGNKAGGQVTTTAGEQ